jgi:hypothetical protein
MAKDSSASIRSAAFPEPTTPNAKENVIKAIDAILFITSSP